MSCHSQTRSTGVVVVDPQSQKSALRSLFAIIVVGILSSAATNARAVLVDFDALDATGGPVSGAALNTYLAGFGITIGNASSPSVDPIVLDAVATGFIVPASARNVFGASGPANGMSYTLFFATTVTSISFTRPQLNASTPSGVTHPQWTATALDAGNSTLSSVGEALLASFSSIPAQSFTLGGGVISSLLISGNAQNFAGFPSPLMDDLNFAPVPVPAALWLFGSALACFGVAGRRHRNAKG